MVELARIDYWIISLLFFLLPVDMINGILLHNDIIFPVSISQVYKMFVLSLLFIRVSMRPNKITLIITLSIILLLPTFYQILKQNSLSFVLVDLIKVTRYLLPLLSFLFFIEIFKMGVVRNHKRLLQLIKFSYSILIINILIKYLGLGYPMYDHGSIGSRGFFHAGNELSVLLIVLSSILAYDFWIKNKTKKYYIFLAINVLAGITLSSKTGILGILIVFFLIPLKSPSSRINRKKFRIALISIFLVLPIVVIVSWKIIKSSKIFLRLSYFWERLDLLTFIFSSRNKYAERASNVYDKDYDLIEKIIGVGQSRFEEANGNKIIEIDLLDIFFVYGFVTTGIFLVLILYIILQALKFKGIDNKYPYASFVLLLSLIIFSISVVAGHVFNSGIAGVFLGILFSLMYIKNNDEKGKIIEL